MSHLADADKGAIIALHEQGFSNGYISRTMGIHKSTVARWIKRKEEDGDVKNRPHTGAHRKTTVSQDRQIRRFSENHPFFSARQIQQALNLTVSSRTVIRRLREGGLRARNAAVKETMSVSHREARLAFATGNVDRTLQFWRRVVFTDEKVFSTAPTGRVLVYRPKGARYDPKYIYSCRRSGRESVTVWAWISAEGCGLLWEVEGRLDARNYVSILENVMLPSVTARFRDDQIIFQHDRSPIHMTRVVKTWFDDHRNITALEWPPKGADMNPIENVWAEMVRIIKEKGHSPSTRRQLSDAIHDAWNDLLECPRYVARVVDSMPNRLRAVVEAEGGYTRY